MAENATRSKGRRIANRGRRANWITGSRVAFEMDNMESELPAHFSISSESDSSAIEKHNSVVSLSKSEDILGSHRYKRVDSEPWMLGCCIWTDQQLKISIENLIGNRPETSRQIKCIFESENEDVWSALPSTCYDVTLLYAAFTSNLSKLRVLLQMGANPLITDEESRNALHYAASSTAVDAGECCRLLIEHGAVVNHWDKQGLATPLICAAALGNVNSVTALLAAGANVQAGLADPNRPDASTALLWAVKARSPACVQLLIEHGAPVNSPQAYSEAPVHVAASQGDEQCLKILLDNHADVRVLLGSNRMSAIHLAAEEGNCKCILLLLKQRADCNATNARGQTPLHLAALAQSIESVGILLDAGARHDIRDNDQKTPLHSAVVKTSRSTEIVRLLINAGADINAKDNFGYTPLHLAAINENSAVSFNLVMAGADFSAKNHGGTSALAFLVRRTPDVIAAIPKRFDSAVIIVDHDPMDADCELQLDLKCLISPMGGSGNSVTGESMMLTSLIDAGQRHLLQHPVCQAFLHLKWHKVRSLFLASLLFHAIFVLSLTANIVSVYMRCSNVTQDANFTSTNTEMCPITLWTRTFSLMTLLLMCLSSVKEVVQLIQSPLKYLQTPENIIQLSLLIGIVFINVPSVDHSIWQRHVAALVIVLAWTMMMMHIGRFPFFGLYIQMFTTVASNIATFMFVYLCLIIGFSLSISILFPQQEALSTLPYSFLATLVMMTGELEYKDYFDHNIPYPGTTHIIFAAFLMFVVIVLMNLLVGLAVSDIQGLQKSAGLDRLVRQTQLIARMECIVFSALFKFLPLTAKSFLKQNVLLVPSIYQRLVTCRPNDPRDDRFPAEIKEGLLKALVCNKKSKKSPGFPPFSGLNDNVTCDHDDLVKDIQQKFAAHLKQMNVLTSKLGHRLLLLEQHWVTVHQTVEQLAQVIKENLSPPAEL